MPVGDLTRNGLDYSNSVLYVRDRKEDNQKLMDYYPGRDYYIYAYDIKDRKGNLRQLEPDRGRRREDERMILG